MIIGITMSTIIGITMITGIYEKIYMEVIPSDSSGKMAESSQNNSDGVPL